MYRALRRGPMGFSKQVAVKRLHPALTEDESILKALINEARLGGQLKHPNIVEIYEFNKVGNSYYLAMEFVDGWTLDRILHLSRKYGLPIPPSVVLEVGSQVCRALEYAHNLETIDGREVRLVHRDLKPGNIILGRDGSAKLMDFGIAKAETNLFKTTVGDVTKGTPHYMSPEQVAGDPNLGPASDIFSMGSVLYEMVSGQVLFGGESLVTILFAVAKAEVGTRLNGTSDVITGFGQLLSDCLARAPGDRIPSAEHLGSRLEALRSEQTQGVSIDQYLYSLRERALQGEGNTDSNATGPDGAPKPQFATLIAPGLMKKEAEEARELRSARQAADDQIEIDRFYSEQNNAPTAPDSHALGQARAEDLLDEKNYPEFKTPPKAGKKPAATRIVKKKKVAKKPKKERKNELPVLGRIVALLALVAVGLLFGVALLEGKLPESQELPASLPTPDDKDFLEGTLTFQEQPPVSRDLPTPAPTPTSTSTSTPTPTSLPPTPTPTPNTIVSTSTDPGFLRIKASIPYYGWVYIDGKKRRGVSTPVHKRIELSPGVHKVRLESSRSPGTLSSEKRVTITSGKVTVLGQYDFIKETWNP